MDAVRAAHRRAKRRMNGSVGWESFVVSCDRGRLFFAIENFCQQEDLRVCMKECGHQDLDAKST